MRNKLYLFLQRLNKYILLTKKIGLFPVISHILIRITIKFKYYINQIITPLSENKKKIEFLSITNFPDNIIPKGEIPLVVVTFFDFDGNNMFFGGAERYIIELGRLVRELGYSLVVYQCANDNWVRYYRELRVIGLNTGGYNPQLLNRLFHKWIPQGTLTIYFQMNLATPYYNSPSICVSHGIDWDNPHLQQKKHEYREFINNVLSSIRNVSQLVSVDTNTINWIRAQAADLSNKCSYIPNFVDSKQFKPVSQRKSREKIVILYPRRLYEARGFWLVDSVIPYILKNYPNLEFHFCGRANPMEEAEVNALTKKYPDKVKWYFLPPEEMHNAYLNTDIVVIPTLYSEGTSLSCLEAMASRKPVITTNVGGLPNLILPDFNGVMINPDIDSLRESLEKLINDEDFRSRISENGYRSSKTFNIITWNNRWRKILQKYLPEIK